MKFHTDGELTRVVMFPMCGTVLFAVSLRVCIAHEIYFAAVLLSERHVSGENETFLAQVTVDGEVLLRFDNGSLSMVGLDDDFVVNQKNFLRFVVRDRPSHILGSSFICTVLDGRGFACSVSTVADGQELAAAVANEERLVILWKSDNLTVELPYNNTEYDMQELNRTLHLWSGRYDEWLNARGLSGFTVRTSVRSSDSRTNLSCVVHSTCAPSTVHFLVDGKTYVPSCVQIGFRPDPLYSCGMTLRRKRVYNASCEIRMGLGHVRHWPFEYEKLSSFARIRRSADDGKVYTTPLPGPTVSSTKNITFLSGTSVDTTMDPNTAELYRRIGAMGGLVVFIIVVAVAFMLCQSGVPYRKKRGRRDSEVTVSLAARRAALVGGAVLE